MDMVDVNKVFRGVLLWREDILKCERCLKKPLSQTLRDLLHGEMKHFDLDAAGKDILKTQIDAAMVERRKRHPNPRRARTLTVDVMAIPATVRKNPKFVKGK